MTGHTTEVATLPPQRASTPDQHFAKTEMPALESRWVHTGAKYLQLLPTPITVAETEYKAFSELENQRIEAAWQALPEEKRERVISEWGREDGEGGEQPDQVKISKSPRKPSTPTTELDDTGDVPSDPELLDSDLEDDRPRKDEQYRAIIERNYHDPDQLDVVEGVAVSQDALFEVNLNTLSLHPVFWPQSGDRIPVLRGTWFMGGNNKPCSWELARVLEDAYQHIKPWTESYELEYGSAVTQGSTGEDKLKHALPEKFGEGLSVIFENGVRCRVIKSGTFNYLSRALWSSLGTAPGGVYVYRGYGNAPANKETEQSKPESTKNDAQPRPSHDEESKAMSHQTTQDVPASVTALADMQTEIRSEQKGGEGVNFVQNAFKRVQEELDTKKKSLQEESGPVVNAQHDDEPCTDLILVVHGIGQHLAAQYESFNFIYASNQLRHGLRNQSQDPRFASIMENRRCQVLPVQWRANLKLESDDYVESERNERDNVFTVADITIGKSIPYVREVTNSVLLDIPLFMSDHRQRMIEAVCQQANRLYRLWVARHPHFEENGRVHIIGHSLGSALAAHILSNQPTHVPKLSDMPKAALNDAKDRFIFNTHNLYLAGSPLGVFLQLQQAHIIPRYGRERTMNADPEDAMQLTGQFGCMATDTLYNVFYQTDPIAYALNAAVDVKVARERPPLPIPAVTSWSLPLPSIPSMPSMPSMPTMPSITTVMEYLPSYLGGSDVKDKIPQSPLVEKSEDVVVEQIEDSAPPLGSVAERRFAALNPRGSIDFYLPTISVNDYLDMITAHGNYWSDPNFAAFLLSETFSSPADEISSNDGLAKPEVKP